MAITVLDQNTINQIAAGEVVERPASVVKELVENAIDAKANAITVEIKEGGISFIRVTDNGCGINASEVEIAFLRHATSKIKSATDLLSVRSLGFRGEALASIASVSMVELITKTEDNIVGMRVVYEGGQKKSVEEVGAPNGTTFVVRNLFYNTPARRKFLKSATTEAAYISTLLEHLSLSHPDISFRLIVNGTSKLHTLGNNNLREIIYGIYDREIEKNLIAVDAKNDFMHVYGFIGKPIISRGNKNFINYYINGRYIKSKLIDLVITDAYGEYMMQHRFPFTALHISIDPSYIDVNVHPTKMEIRFSNSEDIRLFLYNTIESAIKEDVIIPSMVIDEPKNLIKEEPEKIFESNITKEDIPEVKVAKPVAKSAEPFEQVRIKKEEPIIEESSYVIAHKEEKPTQLSFFDVTNEEKKSDIKIVGQVFDTYWIVEYENQMYIIDQHAAHEKVLFERFMKNASKQHDSQMIMPPIIISLSSKEEQVLLENMEIFTELGYEIEPFGGKEYKIVGVPATLYGMCDRDFMLEILDNLVDDNKVYASISIRDKIATMACKAAIKGNNRYSYEEASALIEELLTLDNPFNCPHGRPTIISMSKYELEKKFKRIV